MASKIVESCTLSDGRRVIVDADGNVAVTIGSLPKSTSHTKRRERKSVDSTEKQAKSVQELSRQVVRALATTHTDIHPTPSVDYLLSECEKAVQQGEDVEAILERLRRKQGKNELPGAWTELSTSC